MDVNYGDFGLEAYKHTVEQSRAAFKLAEVIDKLPEDYKPIREITVRRKKERKMVKKMLIAQLIPVGVIIATITLLIMFLG